VLKGTETSLENKVETDKKEIELLNERLSLTDECNRAWRTDMLERIGELKEKLSCSEKELKRLDKIHGEFYGSTDDETKLLERLKFQHELVESDKKVCLVVIIRFLERV